MNAHDEAAEELHDLICREDVHFIPPARIADIIAKHVSAPKSPSAAQKPVAANSGAARTLPATVELIRYASQLALSDPAAVAANWQALAQQLHARAVRASAEVEERK
jgi:hypothetical protein